MMEEMKELIAAWNHSSGSMEVNADYIQQIEELCFPEELELEVGNTRSDYEKLSQIFGILHNQNKRATKTDIVKILKK